MNHRWWTQSSIEVVKWTYALNFILWSFPSKSKTLVALIRYSVATSLDAVEIWGNNTYFHIMRCFKPQRISSVGTTSVVVRTYHDNHLCLFSIYQGLFLAWTAFLPKTMLEKPTPSIIARTSIYMMALIVTRKAWPSPSLLYISIFVVTKASLTFLVINNQCPHFNILYSLETILYVNGIARSMKRDTAFFWLRY